MVFQKKTKAMGMVFRVFFIITILSVASLWADAPTIKIFAAASTTNAITDVCQLFSEKYDIKARPSFASSSTLAKQIENGAPADIFVSANVKWMDYLEKENLLLPDSRFDLLKNRLVLIVPQKSAVSKIDISPAMLLSPIIGDGYMAIGDPDHVPAGIYAKEALVHLGLYASLEPKIARLNTVRAALAMVERREANLGIVYATDAALTNQVKIAGVFPLDYHSPIIYPVAIIKTSHAEKSILFMKFLKTPGVKAVFQKYGFMINE